VYALGKSFLDGKRNKKWDGDANYQFILNKITQEANTELSIDLDQEHILSLSISESNGKLNLHGLYSERNAKRVKGGCVFVIDIENMSVQTKKTHVLPKQVYEDIYGARRAERKNKKKKELKDFSIDHVLTDSKGGTYLIAEEFYITSSYVNTGATGGYSQIIYHYDDILILKFNNKGDLEWGRSILKKSDYPNYNAFLKDDQLHIILNSVKNLKEKKDGRTDVSKFWLQASALYDIEYQINGEESYNKIQDNKGNKSYSPNEGTYETDKFIMMSAGKRKRTFTTLE